MRWRLVGIALFMLGSACDGGTTATDAGVDGFVGEPCSVLPNGAPCGDGLVCVDGACVAAGECGDGAVDPGEQCDDGNDLAFDGCESSCTFTCAADEGCDDGASCNGVERCGADHFCVAGSPPGDGTACTTDMIADGVCRTVGLTSICVSSGCGNGLVETGEDCDDSANGDDADGCRDDCRYTCARDDDCVDADPCNGMETCDTTTHRCVDGTPSIPFWYPDCDGDEYAPVQALDLAVQVCAEPAPLAGCDGGWTFRYPRADAPDTVDCDDSDPRARPGMTERCNGFDDDCEGGVDESVCPAGCTGETYANGEYAYCPARAFGAAATHCASAGMYLVRIDSEAENAFIRTTGDVHASGSDLWIGGTDEASEGVWLWPNGAQFWDQSTQTPVGGLYANWCGGEPNNAWGGTEDYALLNQWWCWNDGVGGDTHPFFCERY